MGILALELLKQCDLPNKQLIESLINRIKVLEQKFNNSLPTE